MERTDALDLIVRLLTETESAPPTSEFYGRLCEALCRLTTMERAVLFLYDSTRHRVTAMGAHELELERFTNFEVTVEDAPIAVRALTEDRVVEVSDGLEREVPWEFAEQFGLTTLTCTPLAAGNRWLGVIIADRGGGGRFELTEAERHTMWTLGKTAALATSARIATRSHDHARRLAERIDLARDIHDRVMQRLFGVSLALSAEGDLTREDRARSAEEIQAALADLRSALQRPLAPPVRDTGTTLRDEIERMRRHYAADFPIEEEWEAAVEIPVAVEPLAQSVLAEALRNAAKHGRPSAVRVRVGRVDGALVVVVANDGVKDRAAPGGGMGLRLAAFEALQHGGVLEFGAPEPGSWQVRLMVPSGER